MTDVTRVRCCRECGEELHPAENDATSLCDACWEDMTQEVYEEFDEVGDAMSSRDDEMGM